MVKIRITFLGQQCEHIIKWLILHSVVGQNRGSSIFYRVAYFISTYSKCTYIARVEKIKQIIEKNMAHHQLKNYTGTIILYVCNYAPLSGAPQSELGRYFTILHRLVVRPLARTPLLVYF